MISQDQYTPQVARVRAYFAPNDRLAQKPTLFDPAQNGSFAWNDPPSPWVDLGWVAEFARTTETVISGVKTGSPASTTLQVRADVDAKVKFAFLSWGKLQMALSCGAQQMNLLAVAGSSAPAASGGAALDATALLSGSTATALNVGADAAAQFPVGSLVVVDVDYAQGTTGFVGSGVSGAYLTSATSDVDYVRRVSLNVARVVASESGVLTLDGALIAGVPTIGMKVSLVTGFCDREGSSFFQEWSALFVAEGQQGDRMLWHYPRLQACAGIAEDTAKSVGGYMCMRLSGHFQALPVLDPVDGSSVVCFRSYVTGLV